MSHTRSVPSIEEDSSQAQSSLTCRSVMRSLWPSNRRTCAMACVADAEGCDGGAGTRHAVGMEVTQPQDIGVWQCKASS